MKKTEFKTCLFELLNEEIDGLSYEDKLRLTEQYFIEYQIKNDEKRERPNYMKSWTDEELRIILADAPTKRNCIKYSQSFGRGYGSIEQIYRWASTTDREVKEKRPDDAFVAHIKQIAKEMGWRA